MGKKKIESAIRRFLMYGHMCYQGALVRTYADLAGMFDIDIINSVTREYQNRCAARLASGSRERRKVRTSA